jgi:CRP/FNR family transcriptional regulator, cyclic AMP receptor protein
MSATDFDRLGRDPAFQEMFRGGHRRTARKGQTILAEGDPPRSLYFILSGSVAVRLRNWHGHEALLALMHAGDFFGEMGLFPGSDGRSATVEAATDCNLIEIPYPVFIELTRRHASLWLELAGQIAARLRSVNRRMAEMPRLHAKDRVWVVVAELAERAAGPRDAGGVQLRVRREDLGKLAACSREAAGLALQELAAEGRLRLSGQSIFVLPGAVEAVAAAASA